MKDDQMLRISALLAIVVGLVLTAKTIVGFSEAAKYSMSGEEMFLAQRLALQVAFALAPVAGGALALWREWRTVLATSWGIILGLAAPHLIHPSIPPAAMQILRAHGGNVVVPGADVAEIVMVVIALAGLVLCGLSESRPSSSS
jgi:hypothetical protein